MKFRGRPRKGQKLHKFTQNYPTERKDYPSTQLNETAGSTEPTNEESEPHYHPTQGNPDDGGKLSPADAERISSEDLPSSGPSEEEEPPKAA